MKKISILRALSLGLFLLAVVCGVIWQTGWGTLSSFGIGSIAQICPVGALETIFASGSPALSVLICLGVFVALVVVFGRFFCGWLCPVPSLRKIFGAEPKTETSCFNDSEDQGTSSTREETFSKPEKSSTSSRVLLSSKANFINSAALQKKGPFFVLAAALVSSAIFSFPVFCLICPVGLTFAFIIGIVHMLKFNDPTITPLVILGVLFLEIFFLRRWCQFICPIGAFISLVSRLNKTFVPKVDDQKCLRAFGLNCQVCRNACPEGIDLKKTVPSTESSRCLKCGACAQRCPVSAISFPFLKKSKCAEGKTTNVVYLKERFPGGAATEQSVVSKASFDAPQETFSLKNAILESSRCIQCGACVKACPQHNPITEVLRSIAAGDTKAAGKLLMQSGKMPELCSQLCPKDKFCMAACPLGNFSVPINIHALMYFASSRALDRGYRISRARTLEKSPSVAVIGAGPAGLAAADVLRAQGYKVTVYEREKEIGGLTMFGIPAFKLSKERILTRRKLYEKSGIDFQLGYEIKSAQEFLGIVDTHDAVLLAIGAENPIHLNVSGANSNFVFQALEYLLGDPKPASLAHDKHVVVLGVGGTALDCARTALRQGARTVTCVFRKSLLKANPPRDDYESALREGAKFLEETQIQSVQPDKTVKVINREGICEVLKADLVICAYGFSGPRDEVLKEAGIVISKGSLHTNLPKVFAAGDAVSGPSFVTTAIESGQGAAKAISQFLSDRCTEKKRSRQNRKNKDDGKLTNREPAQPAIS